MALAPGTRIGSYEILSSLGAGGMGVVYRARDPKLARDVALKVLPPVFAADADRLARFDREARVLATLNHPHIAQIYDAVEGQDASSASPVHALAMELVEGEDLAQVLSRGPMPIAEALAVAGQIADALAAAHDCGVIHRDLKPANIKLRPDGTVKVLDFGLAKLAQPESDVGRQPPADLGMSPTMTSPALMTGAGIILGTAAYMSPEQARGRLVDKRADIWAFGCVLFEMLTGLRAFAGDDVAEVLGAVIHREPRLDLLPPSTAPHVRATIGRCLQKDPRARPRDVTDVRLALDGAFGTVAVPTPVSRMRSTVLRTLIAGAVGASITGAAVWMLREPAPVAAPRIHFQVPPPGQLRYGNFFALSPDGRLLSFAARDALGEVSLWLHSFEAGRSVRLERAGHVTASQFWSPDGQFLGYFAAGVIFRMHISGSPPQEVGRLEGFGGAFWAADDTIVYGQLRGGLMRVSVNGGSPVAVTELDPGRQETGHTTPVPLPDGRHFLYLRLSASPRNSGVFVGSVDAAASAQPSRPLIRSTEQALFAPHPTGGGYLLYVRDGTLMAQPFDPGSLTLSGTATAIVDRIGIGPAGYAQVSVSPAGRLAYRAPDATLGGIPTWFDRSGRPIGPVIPSLTTPGLYPRLSPEGRRLALVVSDGLWVHNLDGRPPVRLTEDASLSPLWTPRGEQVVVEQFGARPGLFALSADGSSSAPRMISPPGHYHPQGFSADGRELLAALDTPTRDGERTWDLVRFGFPDPGDIIRVLASEASEGFRGATLSPDRRWLAYVSDAVGTPELWVRPYPDGGPPVRLSSHGATEPVWAKDGRELLYLEGAKLMSVKVDGSRNTFRFEPPEFLFETPVTIAPQPPSYDVAADGRILLLRPVAASSSPIEVIVNWHAGVDAPAER